MKPFIATYILHAWHVCAIDLLVCTLFGSEPATELTLAGLKPPFCIVMRMPPY